MARHRVVVGRRRAGTQERVVLDDRPRGQVDAGLDRDACPDPDVVVDRAAPPDERVVADRDALAPSGAR